MARDDRHRVLTPELFEFIASRSSCPWRTEIEAGTSGPYRIVQRGAVYSVMADPEPDDGVPVADFTVEQWALLLAATRGARYRDRLLHLAGDPDRAGRFPVHERSLAGEKVKVVGWHSRPEERDLEAMHVAEYVLRSPRRLAHFLEAAGERVLEGAAKILTRRFGLREPGS